MSDKQAILARWQELRRHEFKRKSRYGTRDGRFDNCAECRRDEDDPIHGPELIPAGIVRNAIHFVSDWSPAILATLATEAVLVLDGLDRETERAP